jgi:hypothetical protein
MPDTPSTPLQPGQRHLTFGERVANAAASARGLWIFIAVIASTMVMASFSEAPQETELKTVTGLVDKVKIGNGKWAWNIDGVKGEDGSEFVVENDWIDTTKQPFDPLGKTVAIRYERRAGENKVYEIKSDGNTIMNFSTAVEKSTGSSKILSLIGWPLMILGILLTIFSIIIRRQRKAAGRGAEVGLQ